jgi:hypothetical protein
MKGINMQRVTTWIMLLALLAGCGVSAPSAVRTSTFSPDDDPTAGAVVRSTRQAQATVTRQAQLDEATMQAAVQATQAAVQATQTAEDHAHAAATAVARATIQAIVTEKTAWPLLIAEDFSDNQLGWPLGLKQDHSLAVTSTLEDGRYRWVTKVDNGNSYFNLVPTHSPVITDFVAAVNVKFPAGGDVELVAYGLTFRQVDNDYGFFGITPSGMWQALEMHHTGIYQRQLVSSEWIDTRPGRSNRLEVIGRGSDFVFFINGHDVGMLSAEIDPGRIGLGVDALQSAATTEVEFSNFEVRTP